MAIDYFLDDANVDTTCDAGAPDGDQDLNKTQPGSTTVVIDTSKDAFEELATWDIDVSGDTPINGLHNVKVRIDAIAVGPVEIRWRLQAIDDTGCVTDNSSAYSLIHTTAGNKAQGLSLTWDASSDRLRLSIEMRRSSGHSTVSATISTGNANSVIETNFTPPTTLPLIPIRRAEVHEDPASRDHVVQPHLSFGFPTPPAPAAANPVILQRHPDVASMREDQLDLLLARFLNPVVGRREGVTLPKLMRTAIESFGPEVLHEILARFYTLVGRREGRAILPLRSAPAASLGEVPDQIVVPPRYAPLLAFIVPPAGAQAVLPPLMVRVQVEPDPPAPAPAFGKMPTVLPAQPHVPRISTPIEVEPDPVIQPSRFAVLKPAVAAAPASPVLPFLTVPIGIEPDAVAQPFFPPVVGRGGQLVVPYLIMRPDFPEAPPVEAAYLPVISAAVVDPANPVIPLYMPRIELPESFEVRPDFFKVIRNSVTVAPGITLAHFFVQAFLPDRDAVALDDIEPRPHYLPVIQPVPDPVAGPALPIILFRQPVRHPEEIRLDVLPVFLPVIQGPIAPPGTAALVLPYRMTAVEQIVPEDVKGDWVGTPASPTYYPLISYVVLFQDYRADVFFDPTLYDPSPLLQLDCSFRTTVAGLTATVRLLNKTTGRAEATLVTTANTLTRVVSDTFKLTTAALYQIEVGVPAGGGVEIERAEVIGVGDV